MHFIFKILKSKNRISQKKNGFFLKTVFLILNIFIFTGWGLLFAFDFHQTEEPIRFDNPWLFLKAIQTSYPDICGKLFFDSEVNDWCLKIRNENIYWAHGRLLRKKDIKKWKNWKPVISYSYPENIPNPKDYTEVLLKSLEFNKLIKNRKKEPSPNYTFNQIVYNGKNKSQIKKQLKKIRFLKRYIWVHKRIAPPLKKVEKNIYSVAAKDPAVRVFLKELGSAWGFNWRTIADSGKLSNHSWGTAIDILPGFYLRKKIYWFWEAERNKKWVKIMPSQRWSPPKAVIDAFETEGFIWGGKWELWDNMHFEYRPELIYIKNFMASGEPHKFFEQKNFPVNANKEIKKIKKTDYLKPIFDTAESLFHIRQWREEMEYSYLHAIEFFTEEIKNENKEDISTAEENTDNDLIIPVGIDEENKLE